MGDRTLGHLVGPGAGTGMRGRWPVADESACSEDVLQCVAEKPVPEMLATEKRSIFYVTSCIYMYIHECTSIYVDTLFKLNIHNTSKIFWDRIACSVIYMYMKILFWNYVEQYRLACT